MYAIFGGADFGAGFWDLTAGGAERGKQPREVIDHSIGPVWEANHVWLIFVFVVLWTCFPEAYASITLTMFFFLTIRAFPPVVAVPVLPFAKRYFEPVSSATLEPSSPSPRSSCPSVSALSREGLPPGGCRLGVKPAIR